MRVTRLGPPRIPRDTLILGGEVFTAETLSGVRRITSNGSNILQTSKKLGLRSEASTRFEKQLHPRLALQAQRLAARLMVELCGARMAEGTVDVAAPEPEPHRIVMRTARLQGLLGERIEPQESQQILTRLGFEVEPGPAETSKGGEADRSSLLVTVPYWRHYDVYREADVIEEIAPPGGPTLWPMWRSPR